MYQGKTGKGGFITVIFHHANNCIAKDLTNTSDIYGIVGIQNKEKGTIDRTKPTARTPIIYSTLNPVWHSFQECGPFKELDSNSEIGFELYDADTHSADELIGSAVVMLKDIPEAFEPTVIPLNLGAESGGQLLVEWCYRPYGSGDGTISDDWLLPRHERLKWKFLLERADDALSSSKASSLSLLPPAITQRALSGDEEVIVDLPVKKSIVRVFTSSTFTDTKLERNMLMRDVYPYLSRLCRKLRLTFEVVDMRWGVRETTNDSHNTSALCMKELHKCLDNSLGPAFVCFLGEKYGYRPFPARIPANYMSKMWPFIRQAELEFAEDFMKTQKIKWNLIRIATKDATSPAELYENLGPNKAYAQENDLFLVPAWFKLDTNVPGGEYVLMNITDLIPEFRSNDQATARAASSRWWKIFERMQMTLRNAAKQAFKDTHPFGITYSPSMQRELHFSDHFNISVTHEEVLNGILRNKNSDKQSYCFRSTIAGIEEQAWTPDKPKFIDGIYKDGQMSIDADARELMQKLKEKGVPTALASQRIFDRLVTEEELFINATPEELARLETFDSHPNRRAFCDNFCELISADILESFSNSFNQLAMDPIVSEIRSHLQFQTSKHVNFVPRPHLEKQVKEYITDESSIEGIKNHQFPLVITGPSGVGKSTFMARCATLTKKSNPGSVVISRYIGTTPGSTQLASLLRSICLQIFLLYGVESEGIKPLRIKGLSQESIEKEDDPLKLGNMLLQELCAFPTPSRPIVLFLDALDQLFDPYKLSWIPGRLENPNVRVVVSLLDLSTDSDGASNFESLKLIHPCASFPSSVWTVNVLAFTMAEASQLLEKEMKGRTLTEAQKKSVMECIEKSTSPSPLFVKMLIDFATTWRSFTSPALSTEALHKIKDTKDLVTLLFQQLEAVHGSILVSHAMGYLMASKCGLSGIEMEDLLSCDEEVLSDVYQWWTPPIRRIPPLLWKRIIEDLGTNLVEYAVDEGGHGPTVYKWFHRQFSEVCEERYLATTETKIKYHDILANYFEGLYSSPAEIPFVSKPDNQKHTADRMIPPQPLQFSSLTYNSRKISELPYHHLLCSHPRRLHNSLLSFEFIEAKCGAGMIMDLKIDYKRAEEVLEKLKDPLAPTLKEFHEFILRYSHILGAVNKESHVSYQFHFQALQLALNLPDSSPVYSLAKKQWDQNLCHQWKSPLIKKTKATTSDPCLFTLTSHSLAVMALSVAPNESLVISSDKKKASVIWDPVKGKEIFSFLSKSQVTASCISSDSAECVLGFRVPADEPIKIINLHNGQEVKRMNDCHESKVNDVWISKDKKRIVSCSLDKRIIIWDTESGNPRSILVGHTEEVNKICVNASETIIVSASSDRTLKVWNFSGEIITTIDQHTDEVYSCKFRADGQIMSSSKDKTVRVWNATDFKEVSCFVYPGEVFDFCVSSDGTKLIAVGSDRLVHVRDLRTGDNIAAFVGHMMHVVFCLPMQNDRVITGSLDRTVKIWDLNAEANTQTSSRDNIYRLADSRSVYFRMPDDKTIEVVHFDSNKKLSEIKLSTSTEGKKELVMDISKDGQMLVTIIKPVVLHLWDTTTGQLTKAIPISEDFHTLRISKDKKQMIALHGHNLYFINSETGATDRVIGGENNTVTCNYSEDHQYIATVYHGNYAIKLFNATTGELVSTMLGHTNLPRHVHISEDGKVISGAPDKTLRIWDAKTGKELKCLPQVDTVWDMAISGKFVLVNNRVAVGLWNIELMQLVGLIPASQLPYSEFHVYDDCREVLAVTNKELHWFTFR
eukprot:Phypoly_transcript_00281.p1 GENE.Phypoly_transcript_00281~~Phypoly_transcript_00281.p1  ORF type:complete len:1777 (-),score=249.49 Phypoly_transcript_00281:112-5442(-)